MTTIIDLMEQLQCNAQLTHLAIITNGQINGHQNHTSVTGTGIDLSTSSGMTTSH